MWKEQQYYVIAKNLSILGAATKVPENPGKSAPALPIVLGSARAI
jgi:hypothetical protein